jgi:hypothetical protein
MILVKPPKPILASLDPKDYPTYRICVSGSRSWLATLENKRLFHEVICDTLTEIEQSDPGSPVLFISGAASRGADAMIIDWCAHWEYPCLQMPAFWDEYKDYCLRTGAKNPAGMMRNERMRDISTMLIAFHDGASPGTKHMINICSEVGCNLRIKVVRVTPTPKDTPTHSSRIKITTSS